MMLPNQLSVTALRADRRLAASTFAFNRKTR
jgi:hypothetical protein